MKTITYIKMTKAELEALIEGAKRQGLKKEQEAELIQTNENHTINIMRQVKPLYKWNDIEDMVGYVDILKKMDALDADSIELDDKEVKLILKVLKGAAESGKINGVALDKYVEVYKTFAS